MGFESFRIELRGGQAAYRDVVEVVHQIPHSLPDREAVPMKGATYYLVAEGRHVIEVEIMDAPVKLSCRFTLCHPPTVDPVFLGLVRRLMVRLGMEATIRDDVRAEHSRPFALQEFPKFAAAAAHYIAARREEWIAAFGNETMAATTNEVYQRVILPQCQPGMEQPT